jgi:hypothetical protein
VSILWDALRFCGAHYGGKSMLVSLIVSIALAVGIAAPRAHVVAPAQLGHGHVTAFDTSGGGPPTHQ